MQVIYKSVLAFKNCQAVFRSHSSGALPVLAITGFLSFLRKTNEKQSAFGPIGVPKQVPFWTSGTAPLELLWAHLGDPFWTSGRAPLGALLGTSGGPSLGALFGFCGGFCESSLEDLWESSSGAPLGASGGASLGALLGLCGGFCESSLGLLLGPSRVEAWQAGLT